MKTLPSTSSPYLSMGQGSCPQLPVSAWCPWSLRLDIESLFPIHATGRTFKWAWRSNTTQHTRQRRNCWAGTNGTASKLFALWTRQLVSKSFQEVTILCLKAKFLWVKKYSLFTCEWVFLQLRRGLMPRFSINFGMFVLCRSLYSPSLWLWWYHIAWWVVSTA